MDVNFFTKGHWLSIKPLVIHLSSLFIHVYQVCILCPHGMLTFMVIFMNKDL